MGFPREKVCKSHIPPKNIGLSTGRYEFMVFVWSHGFFDGAVLGEKGVDYDVQPMKRYVFAGIKTNVFLCSIFT